MTPIECEVHDLLAPRLLWFIINIIAAFKRVTNCDSYECRPVQQTFNPMKPLNSLRSALSRMNMIFIFKRAG